MMLAIPLSLIGIVFGHWLLGAYFTATFIGMIALAGVMVRNSVLLIDFIEIRLNDGEPKQAEGSSKNLSYFDDWSSSY
jgi:multidrug efflux pump subunit AcrB